MRSLTLGRALWAAALTVLAGCRPAEPPARFVAPLFNPALAPVLLDEPDRERWQQPDRMVKELRLRAGDSVADIGAGSGFLLDRLSRAVGPRGVVYAEEIQPDFLPALRSRARTRPNVRVVLGRADNPGLSPCSVDCFVLLTVYHEVENPMPFLRMLGRAARPGARLAIIDFDPDRRGYPPPPGNHVIRESVVVREAEAAGWRLARRLEFLSSQFFLVFERA